MAGHDAVFGARGRHANNLLRAEVGRKKGQSGNPCRNRAARKEEIRTSFHIAFKGPTDNENEREVNQENGVINAAELNVHNAQ